MKTFRLPPLPYAADALEPHISALTLQTHHGKHHKAYVDKVNELVDRTPKASWSLERIVRESTGPLFNNAAQAWNHEFYWHSLRAPGGSRPPAALAEALTRSFGGLPDFRSAFTEQGVAHFGSGWAWLVGRPGGKLEIVVTHDAGTPVHEGGLPLLTCDLWEHAYYLDRKQDRAAYLKSFWQVADWSFAAANLERGTAYESVASPGAAKVASAAAPKLGAGGPSSAGDRSLAGGFPRAAGAEPGIGSRSKAGGGAGADSGNGYDGGGGTRSGGSAGRGSMGKS